MITRLRSDHAGRRLILQASAFCFRHSSRQPSVTTLPIDVLIIFTSIRKVTSTSHHCHRCTPSAHRSTSVSNLSVFAFGKRNTHTHPRSQRDKSLEITKGKTIHLILVLRHWQLPAPTQAASSAKKLTGTA